ncbi:MAG: sialidase family protein [Spirochaetia bacterium]
MQHHRIYKNEGSYSCFPDITKAEDGTLIVCFREAGAFSVKAVEQKKYDHVDKGARIVICKSSDNGRSWDYNQLPAFDEERGEQDCSVQALSDGRIIMNFFQWWVVPEHEKERLPYPARQQYDKSWSDVMGPYVIFSEDQGRTWDNKKTEVPSAPLPRAGTADAVAELPGGVLIMGFYGADFGDKVCRAYSVISRDGGRTWGDTALIAEDPDHKISFEEPSICLREDGSLIALLRAGEPGEYTYLYSAFSRDGGLSWSDLGKTPMWGHPPCVNLLRDGRLLCCYGYRREPFGVRAALSDDGGRTWNISGEIILRDDGCSRDVGYPSTVQLDDGSLYTVYYIHGEDNIRHIAGTHWKIEE